MARYKDEVDGTCRECKYYHYAPAHISLDAYHDYPEEHCCDKDWQCPFIDDKETKMITDIISSAGVRLMPYGKFRGLPVFGLKTTDMEVDVKELEDYITTSISNRDRRLNRVLFAAATGDDSTDPLASDDIKTVIYHLILEYVNGGPVNINVITNGRHPCGYRHDQVWITAVLDKEQDYLVNPNLCYNELVYPVDDDLTMRDIVVPDNKAVFLMPCHSTNTRKTAEWSEKAFEYALTLQHNIRVIDW
jgi:hypothetical protein